MKGQGSKNASEGLSKPLATARLNNQWWPCNYCVECERFFPPWDKICFERGLLWECYLLNHSFRDVIPTKKGF
jgi:hypothetical protein